MVRLVAVVVMAIMLVPTVTVLAQPTVVDIKTPPGAAGSSDPLNLPTFLPSTGDWVGVRLKLNLLDPTEVQSASITARAFSLANPGTPSLLGTITANVSGSGIGFAQMLISVANSGIDDPVSIQLTGSLIPKGTSVGDNSDVDLTAMLWNLRHINNNSEIFLLPSGIYDNSVNGLLTPASGPPGWYHNAGTQGVGFVPTVSAVRGRLIMQLNVGVEHERDVIPEPVSMGIWGCGLLCAMIGYRARRRRLSTES